MSAIADKDRLVFIDYIRVVACLMVMMVHAAENFYVTGLPGLGENMTIVPNEVNRFWLPFWNGGLSRTCVPLFIIVSAFLLVPMKPGVTMGQFYKRRFLRILPPMFIFMVLYSVLPMLWGEFSWDEAKNLLLGLPFNFPSNAYHLWFMYPLISLYLIIPVVSPWLEKASARDERIFLAIFAISTFLPFLHKLTPLKYVWGECWWNNYHALWYCSGYLGYLVMAHYIRFHIDWSTRKRVLVGLACFLAGGGFTFWSHWSMGVPGQPIHLGLLEYAWEFCTPNVLLASFGLFLLFTCIRQKKAPRIITELSKLSFGMYLMHVFFITPIAQFFVNGDPANPLIHIGLAIPLSALLCFVVCAAVSKLISLIPGSKWVIG
jgi:surface polysaccharide O-acyltransferase-like enzyme